jgi:RNA polymerase sigma-70 factor (ECF subfamily)
MFPVAPHPAAALSPAALPDDASIYRQIVSSVRRVCPAWLAGLREDIAQAAMLRVIGARKKIESGGGLTPSYLWKVACTATVDELRRIRRERAVPIAVTPDAETAADSSDPLGDLRFADLGRVVHEGLVRLKPRRRLVVGLHLMGYTVAEMMRYTAWDERKVRNLLFRGLAELRAHLKARGLA